MGLIEVESVHKSWVTVHIFAPIVGQPMSDQHDSVGRETERGKVGCAANTD